ncbi:hypothetical protein STCU_04899 [Strigomonas culicis]|uniref:DUF2062 domain-containing protein n=1 Tax=Strigomonas culicis TaxID=28005 RepID=S9VP10_9TRYP|nr:hypothetical protein STCU_04899 [Strigomonas culicis]|eukprot:EPY28751.1 hypothetical protein STCU_04899 [Strigomonas culicis]
MGTLNRKIRAAVRGRLIEPLKQMTLFESMCAVLVGFISGVFPVPLTTALILLLLGRILALSSVQLVVATTVNVLSSPLQIVMIPLYAQWMTVLLRGDASLYTATALYSALEKGYINFFLSSASFLSRSAAMWMLLSAPVIGVLFIFTRRRVKASA